MEITRSMLRVIRMVDETVVITGGSSSSAHAS